MFCFGKDSCPCKGRCASRFEHFYDCRNMLATGTQRLFERKMHGWSECLPLHGAFGNSYWLNMIFSKLMMAEFIYSKVDDDIILNVIVIYALID